MIDDLLTEYTRTYGPPTADLPWAVYTACCERLGQFDAREALYAIDGAHMGTTQAIAGAFGGDTIAGEAARLRPEKKGIAFFISRRGIFRFPPCAQRKYSWLAQHLQAGR